VVVLPEPRKPAKRIVGIGFLLFFDDVSKFSVDAVVSEDVALRDDEGGKIAAAVSVADTPPT
jgi:hypothetical protein